MTWLLLVFSSYSINILWPSAANWVNICWGNGLLPGSTKLLPLLTYHQWGPVTFIGRQFHKRYPHCQLQISFWKLFTYKKVSQTLCLGVISLEKWYSNSKKWKPLHKVWDVSYAVQWSEYRGVDSLLETLMKRPGTNSWYEKTWKKKKKYITVIFISW